jgi:DNA polymerase (family 10)
MENPHVDIIGHPTGRMLGKRPAYAMDMEAVIAKAVETGTVLEVSGQPHRLDLTDSNVRMAVAAGAKLSIDTDAHSLAALDYMRFGVMNARRGWASPKDVVNTRTWKQLKRLLK